MRSQFSFMHRFNVLAAVVALLGGVLNTCTSEPEVMIDASILLEGGRILRGYPVRLSAKIPPHTSVEHISFSWDFGDGLASSGIQVEHTYRDTGMYDVKLTLEGKTGSNSMIKTLEVHPSLELLASVPIRVDEPSGLTLGAGNASLWTVSDMTGDIYELDFDGQVKQIIDFNGNDLEGISYDARDSSFWICSEGGGEILHVDSTGHVMLQRDIPRVLEGSGLEGISVDIAHANIYAMKEKDHCAVIRLNDSLETEEYTRVGFAPDLSGVCYSESMQKLWVLSHEASRVYLTDTTGLRMKTYGIFMKQPEGIAFDDESRLFYIVDDAVETLNTYRFWSTD